MAEYLIQDSTLTAIGDAIRSKTGGTELITPENMPTEIEGMGSGGGASTAKDVSYINTQLPNVANVGEALDELVPNSHIHDNKSILDKLSDTGGKLQYAGSDVGLKGDIGATGPQGDPGADGYTPVKGTDYWTAADKSEIVDDVLAALPTWTGGSY